jgi:hypothetical protein
MGLTWTWIIELALKILLPLFNLVTPEIKQLLNDFLTGLYLKALATPNPWDDMAVGFLMDILAIPRPPPV